MHLAEPFLRRLDIPLASSVGCVSSWSLASRMLVANHACEIPFSIFTEFEVITIVTRDFRGYTFGTPVAVDSAAGYRALQIAPRSLSFVFVDKLQPLPGSQAASSVKEIGWHHSQQCGVIPFVYGTRELPPERGPTSFSNGDSGRGSFRKGGGGDKQQN